MSKSFRTLAVAAAAVAALSAPQAHAALGDALVATGGNILITFEGTDADYNSFIRVNGGSWIFPNKTTPVGTTLDLGFFAAGTLLDIELKVVNTGHIFRTGPAAGNPDKHPHANVVYNWKGQAGRTWVGFEDLYNGGDKDYNDHMFSFTNITAQVPEPETYGLMLAGLGVMGFLARRRRQA